MKAMSIEINIMKLDTVVRVPNGAAEFGLCVFV
jgi:hypothetical protein